MADGLLLTVPAAAKYLGVPPRRVYAWIAAGRIPSAVIKRMGRAVYLLRPALEDWAHSTDETKPGGVGLSLTPEDHTERPV